MPSSCASSITTSVLFGCAAGVLFALGQLRLDLAQHLVGHHGAQASGCRERSQASCRVTKLRLAAARKPSVSKPGGHAPVSASPPGAEPICTPAALRRACRRRRPCCCAPTAGPRRRCRPCPGCTGAAASPGRPARRALEGIAAGSAAAVAARRMMTADHDHDDQRQQGDHQELAEGLAQAQRIRQPGQAQARGQAAEHGAPGTLGRGRGRRWRRAARPGRAWLSARARPGRLGRLALRHVAGLPADRAAAAEAAGRLGIRNSPGPAPPPSTRTRISYRTP